MTATYPTLTAFLDALGKPELDEAWKDKPTERLVVETFILNLLTRWQLEDEGAPPTDETLVLTQSELAKLSKEMTDAERVSVLQTLMAWASGGDAWLFDYIDRYTDPQGLITLQ